VASFAAACAAEDHTSRRLAENFEEEEQEEHEEMGWGVMMLMDEAARVRDMGGVRAAEGGGQAGTSGAAASREQSVAWPRTPKQLADALAHLSPISGSSSSGSGGAAHPSPGREHKGDRRQAPSRTAAAAVPKYVSSPPPPGMVTQASMASTTAQTPHKAPPSTQHTRGSAPSSASTPPPARMHADATPCSSTAAVEPSFSTPPTVRKDGRKPAPAASEGLSDAGAPSQLSLLPSSHAQLADGVDFCLFASGRGKCSEREGPAARVELPREAAEVPPEGWRGGTGRGQAGVEAAGLRYAEALRDKEELDQGLSRLEAHTCLVI